MIVNLLQIKEIISWLTSIALGFGYLGVFLACLIGTLSVIIPVPYTALIFMLGVWLDPILLALSAGAGSSLGELIGYFIGYYSRSLISEEKRRKMNYLTKILDKYGAPLIIFLFALTPLPDDLLFIPLGIMRYPLTKTLIFSFLGKTVMSLILAYGGRFSIKVIEMLIGSEDAGFLSAIITMVLLIVVIVIMLKVDWEKTLEKYLR